MSEYERPVNADAMDSMTTRIRELEAKLAASEKRAEAWKKAWDAKNRECVLRGYEQVEKARDALKLSDSLMVVAHELDKEAGQ